MYEVGVSRELMARHFLEGDFGEESTPHVHPYRVEVVCRTEALDENGFAVNIAFLEEELERVLAEIDDVLLNDLPFFKGMQPSLENLCRYLWRALTMEPAVGEPGGPSHMTVKVWESQTAWASYSNGGAAC